MAKAEKHTETVTTTTIHLELTEVEADTLLAIGARIAGSKNSPRQHMDNIRDALREAVGHGFHYLAETECIRDDEERGIRSGIRFNDYEDE